MTTDRTTVIIPFRALPKLRDAIDEAAKIRGWTRTTWILYWLGKGLDHDRELFALTEAERQRDIERRAAKVQQVKRWRQRTR